MKRRSFLKSAAAGASLAALAPRMMYAHDYPSHSIRIVVPNSASTPPDILARIAANALTEGEGWSMIVENKPGGIVTIAASEVLKQEPDGYTLLSVGCSFTAAPALLRNASFSPETDFVPVVHLATGYNVLVVNPRLAVHSVSELIEFLKNNPDKHTFSSGGFGTPAHLLGEMFKLETGVQTTHVPYSQLSQAIADLLSGVNSYQFITALPVVQLVQSGTLRALAVMSSKRVAALKDVPTIVETGYPRLASEDWIGLVAKSGTPPAIIARLNAAMNKALKTEKVLASLAKMGVDAVGGSAEEFGARVRDETARWAGAIKNAGIKINP